MCIRDSGSTSQDQAARYRRSQSRRVPKPYLVGVNPNIHAFNTAVLNQTRASKAHYAAANLPHKVVEGHSVFIEPYIPIELRESRIDPFTPKRCCGDVGTAAKVRVCRSAANLSVQFNDPCDGPRFVG